MAQLLEPSHQRTRTQLPSILRARHEFSQVVVVVLVCFFFNIRATEGWILTIPQFPFSTRIHSVIKAPARTFPLRHVRVSRLGVSVLSTTTPSSENKEQQPSSSTPEPEPEPSTSSTDLLASAAAIGDLQFPVFPSDRSREKNSQESQQRLLLHAAASVTQESCPLLGVKSIGVDYGLVRTGVAVTVGYEPKPIDILVDLNNTQVAQQVVQHARAQAASRIIVGLPLHKNGTVAEQTVLTWTFARELAQCVQSQLGPLVPVVLWDERYTSKEAAARAHSQDPDRYLYGTLDADAACIILEHYYHDGGVGAVPVSLPDDVRQKCLEAYEELKKKEQASSQAALDERAMKIQRRKDAIARSRALEEEQRALNGSSPKKKKKKKRRKR